MNLTDKYQEMQACNFPHTSTYTEAFANWPLDTIHELHPEVWGPVHSNSRSSMYCIAYL